MENSVETHTEPATKSEPTETVAAASEVEAKSDSPVTEAKPEVKTEDPVKESISAKYAQLAKAEHQLRSQRADLESKQKAWQAEQEAIKKEAAEIAQFRAEAKRNPLKALETLNISLEDLTEQILNQEKPGPNTELKIVKEEVQRIKEEFQKEKEELARKQREAEQARLSQMYNSYVDGLKKLVETDKELEYVGLLGEEGINNIVKTVELTYTKNKKLLSEKEAASQVNAAVISDVDNFLKDERVKRRIQEVYGIQFDKKEDSAKAKAPKTTKTLTNGLLSDASKPLDRILSDEERLERALSVIKYAS